MAPAIRAVSVHPKEDLQVEIVQLGKTILVVKKLVENWQKTGREQEENCWKTRRS
jgi:hypothetical protein